MSFFPRWNCKGCWFLTVQTIKSNSKLATVLRRFSNIKVTPRSSYTWIIYHYQTRHWYVYASALRSRIQQQKMMITLLYNLTKEWVSKVCNVLWCWSDQEISLLIQFDTDISASCNTTSPPYFTLVLRWSSLNSWVEQASAPSQESWPILPIRFASFSSLIISDQIFIGIRLCLE